MEVLQKRDTEVDQSQKRTEYSLISNDLSSFLLGLSSAVQAGDGAGHPGWSWRAGTEHEDKTELPEDEDEDEDEPGPEASREMPLNRLQSSAASNTFPF